MKTPRKRIKPYVGDEPYIFVSYPHRNSEAVMPVLQTMQEQGFRFWYDEGIDPGTEWDDTIAEHILKCDYFLALLSPEYIQSSNCKDELNYARDLDKDRLLVYLSPVELPAGMSMRLGRLQAIHAYKYQVEEEFYEKLFSAHGISRFRSEPPKPAQETKKAAVAVGETPLKQTESATRERNAERMEELRNADLINEAVNEEWEERSKPQPVELTVMEKDDPTELTVQFPLPLLHKENAAPPEDRDEILADAEVVLHTLSSFGVKIESLTGYDRGPTVTRYELEPKSGTRMSVVSGLSADLTVALQSCGPIRIEAPIAGTDRIAVEVPNRTRRTVYLREILESPAFSQSQAPLTAALGVDTAGNPIVFDLAKMPHLLIGGTTGSGKSIAINAILASLLYRNAPSDVRFILIDPKRVEFGAYRGISHLFTPVISDPKAAAAALTAAVEEMESRYKLLAQLGLRDVKSYDDLRKRNRSLLDLPRIVIVIDELADLMMTVRDEVETAICHLAQKARAVGIHLILGTQLPSVDVLTGVIKANIPSVLAFSVPTLVQSRALLDQGDARKLLGRGDMIFRPVGALAGLRVQGAFVDDYEIVKICDHLRKTVDSPVYSESHVEAICRTLTQDEPLYLDAVRFAIWNGGISVSILQRKLNVGFNRAAKLLMRMEEDGVVSPPQGIGPRKILLTYDQFLERLVR